MIVTFCLVVKGIAAVHNMGRLLPFIKSESRYFCAPHKNPLFYRLLWGQRSKRRGIFPIQNNDFRVKYRPVKTPGVPSVPGKPLFSVVWETTE